MRRQALSSKSVFESCGGTAVGAAFSHLECSCGNPGRQAHQQNL